MKKIYSVIALCMLLFAGAAQAQHRWAKVGENLGSIDDLKIGENAYYVIQEGDNTKADGSSSDGHSQNGYLNSLGGVVQEIKHECVFSFVDTKREKNGHKVFVLKNLANGKYVKGSGNFTQVKAEAFQFTVQKGEFIENATSWDDYSKAMALDGSSKAEEIGGWVFCSPDRQSYMCFWSSPEPTISSYIDTNNWLIYEVKEEEMTAFEKFTEIYSQYFVLDVNKEIYPVGTAPGCISEELYNRLEKVYVEAQQATGVPSTPAETCDRLREEIISVFADVKAQTVPVTPGYYILINQRSKDWAYDENGYMKCTKAYAGPSTWDLASTKYIWKVVPSVDGKFFFQDWGSGRYIGKNPGRSRNYQMVADSVSRVGTEYYQGGSFRLQGGDGWIHNDDYQKCVHWDSYGAGNLWQIVPVSKDTIAKLEGLVNQNHLNKQLKALAETAKTDWMKNQYKNHFIATGLYSAPEDSGLVRKYEAANATETLEGSEAASFDGNLESYYHTFWRADLAPQHDWHWVQVDLGKDVQDLVVKFSFRHNNDGGNPSRVAWVASKDGNYDKEAVWEDTLHQDTVIYTYPTYFPGGKREATTYIDTLHFEEPVRHLRMAVTRTKNNKIFGAGPCWHVSELRFYDLQDCVSNPNLALVPQAVCDALTSAIDKAEEELAANAATAETYEMLDAALNAFWEAYPDASGLKEALANAKEQADLAKEGDQLGFFQEGAKDALLATVAEITAAVEAKEAEKGALTLEEIDELQQQLDAALADFNGKLNVPEGDKIYRIVSCAGWDSNNEEKEQSNTCIASVNADWVNGTPVWRYKMNDGGAENRLNALWWVEKTDKGYSFKNLANGLYMGNDFDGLTEEEIEANTFRRIVGYSKEPKYFQLESFTADNAMHEGAFLITLMKGQYVNLQPGGNVVRWHDRNDPHAPFTFEAVEDEYDATTYTVDVQGGKTQIVTLPIDIEAVYTADQHVYEVIGKKDNTIQLRSIDGKLAAGTPFIIKTQTAEEAGGEAETRIDCELAAAEVADYLNMAYNYEPVVQNGMVSAPVGFTTTAASAFGVLFGETVIATEGGDLIAAGTGFFNNTLPETTEDGDAVLTIEGDITGEGTAVQQVELVKNTATDVYTLAGVKVRQAVKAGAATKGLPKGIYIVGGKKVIVK